MAGRDEAYLRRLRARLAEVADGRELEALARGRAVPESVQEIRALIAEQTCWETLSREGQEPFAYWNTLVSHVNELRCMLDAKPRHLRLGYHASLGGILNAYREGDLSFSAAVEALQSQVPEVLSEPERRELADVLAGSERYDPHGDEPAERALQSGLRKALGLPLSPRSR